MNINPNTFIEFLKFNKFNIKNIGGYYPSNYEIDDLSILELLGRKNYRIALPSIKKLSNGLLQMVNSRSTQNK